MIASRARADCPALFAALRDAFVQEGDFDDVRKIHIARRERR